MSNIDYNNDLLGFITHENGITSEDWGSLAKRCDFLVERVRRRTGINPFTGEETEFKPARSHVIVKDGKEVGLFAWEAANAVGVAGLYQEIEPQIEKLCEACGGRFEKVQKQQ